MLEFAYYSGRRRNEILDLTWSKVAFAAGVVRLAPGRSKTETARLLLHDCRRTAARNLVRAGVPERVAMVLTGHKTRSVFDRYNIVNERELFQAGDQLVAYLKRR